MEAKAWLIEIAQRLNVPTRLSANLEAIDQVERGVSAEQARAGNVWSKVEEGRCGRGEAEARSKKCGNEIDLMERQGWGMWESECGRGGCEGRPWLAHVTCGMWEWWLISHVELREKDALLSGGGPRGVGGGEEAS
jgi:hypothetical protein